MKKFLTTVVGALFRDLIMGLKMCISTWSVQQGSVVAISIAFLGLSDT